MTAEVSISKLPDTLFRMNAVNKLVIRPPMLYQAVIPVTWELDVEDFPADLKGIPQEQEALQQYLQTVEAHCDTLLRPLRDGFLYVFRENALWAEYRVYFDSTALGTRFQPIDLSTEQGKNQRQENSAKPAAPYILVPKEGDYQIAYSEGQWPWVRIQLLGGLHKEWQLPAAGIPAPAADQHLVDWSPQIADALRQERCHTQATSAAPLNGSWVNLDAKTQTPSSQFPVEFCDHIMELQSCADHNDALAPEEWVIDWVLLPIKDPLLIAQQMSQALRQAVDVLDKVNSNMQDPDNSHYPHAKFYQSALLAYQVFYERGALPKGTTRWQQDQNSDEAFENLDLAAIEAALALDLRHTLYDIITLWQTRLAEFIDGQQDWSGWEVRLRASLEDFWSMADVVNGSKIEEDNIRFWGCAHRRWYHLENLLNLLCTPPQSASKIIERDPVSLEKASAAQQNPGPKLIERILQGQHPLCELVFNTPQVALYQFQTPLVELVNLQHQYQGKAYDNNLYQQEKSLLASLPAGGVAPTMLYQPDVAALHEKDVNKKKEEEDGALKLAEGVKISVSLARLTSSMIGSMGATALKLGNDKLSPNTLNSIYERLRHLFNTIQDAHLKYTSFNSIYEKNLDNHTGVISTFFTQLETERTRIIDQTTPGQYMADKNNEFDRWREDTSRRYATERREIKKQLRDHDLPEYRKQFTDYENQLRSEFADMREYRTELDAKIRRSLLQHNDGRGIVEEMEAAASQDPAHQDLLQQQQALDEQYRIAIREKQNLDKQIASINQQIADLHQEFEAERVARKNGIPATDLETRIADDAQHYSPYRDQDNPVNRLLQSDQHHLNQIRHQEAKITAEVDQYQADFNSTIKGIESEGKTPINLATAEGRELVALREAQQQKLLNSNNTTVITTNEGNYEQLRAQYQNSPDHLVLDQEQSELWNSQREGNYLVLENGDHLYAVSPEQGVASNRLRDVSLGAALMVFDMINFYNAAAALNGKAENAKSGRNVMDFMSNLMGTASSSVEFWQLIHTSRSYLNQAEKLSTSFGKVMLNRVGAPSALAKTVTYLGVVGAGLGLVVSIIDSQKNAREGDDAFYADTVLVMASLMSVANCIFVGSAAILGPAAIVVTIVGVLLKLFIFREDDLLKTWLEHGPFSKETKSLGFPLHLLNHEEASGHRLLSDDDKKSYYRDVIIDAPHLHTWQTSVVSYLAGIKDELRDKNGATLRPVAAPFACGHIIMDQNYKVLGVSYTKRHRQEDGPKLWLLPNDNTVYVKQNGDMRPLTRIGSTLASTKAGVANLLAEKYQEIVNPSAVGKDKDILNQLADDLAEWSEEDFILPMRDEKYGGYGSLELLLNGLFPVTAKMSLHPLDQDGKRLIKRSGLQAWDGIYDWDSARELQARIEIDAPYFVPNKSSLSLKITSYDWWKKNETLSMLNEIPIEEFPSGIERENIVVKKFGQITASQKDVEAGDYFLSSQNKIIIIRNISLKKLVDVNTNLRQANLLVWIRLSVEGEYGNGKESYLKPDSLWFPFRKYGTLKDAKKERLPYNWVTASSA